MIHLPFDVQSSWFAGHADVPTFALEELIATKVRALFMRDKGRDLFDLWLALTRLGVEPVDLIEAFEPYRPVGFTIRRAEDTLRTNLTKARFRNDLRPLVATWPEGYDLDSAAGLVIEEVLARIG